MSAIVVLVSDWIAEHVKPAEKSEQVARWLADVEAEHQLRLLEERLRAKANTQAVA